MSTFDGKVAAITGAGSGMGRTLALLLAQRGCAVAVSDVNEEGLAETVRQLGGAKVTSARVDVAKRDEVFAWAEAVVRDHGRCHFIFNNAGVALGAMAEQVTPTDFQWIMGINFWGVVHGTQAFLPHLRATGDGHVINTSSVFGLIAFPGSGAYNASKFAVRGYTEALAIELQIEGAPVRVTSVHPGGIKTMIARKARMHESVKTLGPLAADPKVFERTFRTTAEDAAAVILDGVARNKTRVLIGNDAKALDVMQRLVPSLYKTAFAWVGRKQLRRGERGDTPHSDK